jgi:Tfp pilus assembly protein PilN
MMINDELFGSSNIEILLIVGGGLLMMNWVFGLLFLSGLALQLEHAQRQAQSKTMKLSRIEHDAGHLMLVSPVLR